MMTSSDKIAMTKMVFKSSLGFIAQLGRSVVQQTGKRKKISDMICHRGTEKPSSIRKAGKQERS
jgi:hypothetical protein